jgi:predicted DsbA family dithiol-disulfide isomerase
MSDDERPTLHVFYDYTCPYAYVGKVRAERLARELNLQVAWLPWEIHPTRAAMGEPRHDGKEGTPVRGWIAELAAEVGARLVTPPRLANSNLALRGAEVAKDHGEETFQRYHSLVFDALWLRGQDVSDPAVLAAIAQEAGMDARAFGEAIRHHATQARLDEVDRKATLLGVQRVPTFVFGDQRIVGNDRFEASLRAPVIAFLERRKAVGMEKATTLREDAGLEDVE